MKRLAISVAVGAAALFATAASAAPLSTAPLSVDVAARADGNVQNVRMVCNENGRCWRERSERRVIIREPGDSYGYDRRERVERRGWDDDRRGGVGIDVPGVSVGIGRDHY